MDENKDGANDVGTEDLGTCFGRLRVGRKRRSALLCTKRDKPFKSKYRIPTSNTKSSSVPRKLLQDPKLKLPDELASKIKIKNSDSKSSENEHLTKIGTDNGVPTVKSRSRDAIEYGGTEVTVSCGMQHVASSSLSLSEMTQSADDTSPEELAAYFEQLLHIPKPMSTMAEMMYA